MKVQEGGGLEAEAVLPNIAIGPILYVVGDHTSILSNTWTPSANALPLPGQPREGFGIHWWGWTGDAWHPFPKTPPHLLESFLAGWKLASEKLNLAGHKVAGPSAVGVRFVPNVLSSLVDPRNPPLKETYWRESFGKTRAPQLVIWCVGLSESSYQTWDRVLNPFANANENSPEFQSLVRGRLNDRINQFNFLVVASHQPAPSMPLHLVITPYFGEKLGSASAGQQARAMAAVQNSLQPDEHNDWITLVALPDKVVQETNQPASDLAARRAFALGWEFGLRLALDPRD